MGTMIQAKCEKCGFQKEFLFGAGMNDFMSKCDVPAINTKTGKFVVKNIFDTDSTKVLFRFYNDPKMNLNTVGNDDIQWGEIFIGRTENFCPSYKSFSLNFEEVGFFD